MYVGGNTVFVCVQESVCACVSVCSWCGQSGLAVCVLWCWRRWKRMSPVLHPHLLGPNHPIMPLEGLLLRRTRWGGFYCLFLCRASLVCEAFLATLNVFVWPSSGSHKLHYRLHLHTIHCDHMPSSAKYSTIIMTDLALPYEMTARFYRLWAKPGSL